MSDRIFLDTNVFIYAAGRENRAKQKIADRLIGEAITRGNGVVSYQVV
jgi:predicted nucleic acid-binding protein